MAPFQHFVKNSDKYEIWHTTNIGYYLKHEVSRIIEIDLITAKRSTKVEFVICRERIPNIDVKLSCCWLSCIKLVINCCALSHMWISLIKKNYERLTLLIVRKIALEPGILVNLILKKNPTTLVCGCRAEQSPLPVIVTFLVAVNVCGAVRAESI